MSEEHGNFIKTPKQLVIIVVLAFVVPIMFIILLSQLMTGDKKMRPDEPPTAIAERIKPIGELVVATPATAPAPAPAAAAVPAPTTAPIAAATLAASPAPAASVAALAPAAPVAAPAQAAATGGKGKAVYETTCMVCHGAGIAGSPKFGDKAAWALRIQTGIEALYKSALKGKNAMPPKGGNVSLPDADIKSAVDYMVALAK